MTQKFEQRSFSALAIKFTNEVNLCLVSEHCYNTVITLSSTLCLLGLRQSSECLCACFLKRDESVGQNWNASQ